MDELTRFPLLPIPVVRAIITNAAGLVLVLRRANTDYGPGAWCLPGGKVDHGQTVEDALHREVLEETGLAVDAATFLFYQDSLPPEPGGMHCVNFYFHCHVRGELRLNDESSSHAWIGPGDLGAYHIVFRNDEALQLFWQH